MKTIDEMIAVMERFRDGAPIQYRYSVDGVEYGWYDALACEVDWNWNKYDYRGKPVTTALEIYIDPKFTTLESLNEGCWWAADEIGKPPSCNKKVTITWEE